MRMHLFGACIAAALITMLCALVPSARAATEAAGKVRFVQAADSSFDPFLRDASTAEKDWIEEHYWRMRAYSSFFDSRTSWYPRAWAYKDAYAIYRGQEEGEEQWILKDGRGRRLYIPFACSGGTCTQYAADIGNPGWRRAWIADAKSLVAKGYRGIFVDDVNLAFKVSDGDGSFVAPIDPRTAKAMTETSWQRYMAEFMEQLRAALPASAEIVHNQVYFHAGIENPYVRRAIDAATRIEFERGFNDTGIRGGDGKYGYDTAAGWVEHIHSRGKGLIYDVQADWGREYALANYYLYANGQDAIGMGPGGKPDDWWSGWETDLGTPLGNRYEWQGVKRRDFQRGSVLVNPPDAPARTLALGKDARRLDASWPATVKLDAREGAVLVSASQRGPASPAPSPVATAPEPPVAAAAPARCETRTCRNARMRLSVRVTRAGRGTVVLRGRARGREGRRARVLLRHNASQGWVTVRRVTRRVDRHGRLRATFAGLPAGTYRAIVTVPGARASASQALRFGVRA